MMHVNANLCVAYIWGHFCNDGQPSFKGHYPTSGLKEEWKRKHQTWWETKKNRNALSECEKKYIKLGRPERSTEK